MNRWNVQIDEITRKFIHSFEGLNDEDMNWKPDAKTWSIAQVLNHLIMTNESYFPILKALNGGNYKPPLISKAGFIVSLFGNMILKTVSPTNSRKVKTFSLWEPAHSNVPPGILDKFKSHQAELKKQIEVSSDQVEQGAVISSPANRYMVYKIDKAFDILVAHEQRHYQQALKVYELLQSS